MAGAQDDTAGRGHFFSFRLPMPPASGYSFGLWEVRPALAIPGIQGGRFTRQGLYHSAGPRFAAPPARPDALFLSCLQLHYKEQKMKTRAAVAFAAGKPLEICEVDLEGPKAGEVLVELKATGVCHTDAFTLSGDDPEGEFPVILGHEGAGVVLEVGPGVKSLKPGDHVIPLYTAEC